MSNQQASYRQIVKATSLFGGVQVFNILIAIIKSKVIAVLLGPAGMGIIGLLTSTTNVIASMTDFGLRVSAVKDVAGAHANSDPGRVSTVISAFRKLVWITGLLGTLVTLAFSSYLSEITFGNKEYSIAFIWLSVTLLFKQLSSGQNVVLQGMRKLKYLANANLLGSMLGLVVSLPLYFYYGIDGIVPAIILSALCTLALSWYFSNKVKIRKKRLSLNETFREGKSMLVLGFYISINGFLVIGVSYVIRVYISNMGGVSQVGLYDAGFKIITTYVSMIFAAMQTDYFPRLSTIVNDTAQTNSTVTQQAEIAILILAPILMVFFIFNNIAILLLYSSEFIQIQGMLQWATMGMFFKTLGWALGFIFIAKGDAKLFLINELTSNAYMLALNILGYKLFGLDGLGLAFLISYVIYFIQVLIFVRIKYRFRFDRLFPKLFGTQLLIGIICLVVVRITTAPIVYLIGSVLIVLSTLYSIRELNRRLDLLTFVKNLFK